MSLHRAALVTAAALVLSFAAADDITTDNATTFRLEYTILVVSAAWLCFLALNLVRRRHYVLGVMSLVALGSALWGQRAIRPGITPGLWPQYVVTMAAYGWFWVLCLILAWRARATSIESARSRNGGRRQ